ncbi:MAG: 50S ribosomal protein L18e [archaeon]
MTKSKTKIEQQLQRKRNQELVETIIKAKKSDKWLQVAEALSCPRRKRAEMNLNEINKKSKSGEIILIPGKVLSQGELDKKIKIAALNFSGKAREKITKAGASSLSILELIKENPKGEGIKILK